MIAPEPVDYVGVELIESAVKSVVAARNRVIFVAPSIPTQNDVIHDPTAARILAEANRQDLNASDSELKWRLTSLGATFARIEDPTLMQLVASQIGLLQSGKSRGRVSRTRG